MKIEVQRFVCVSYVYAQKVDINNLETGRVAGLECFIHYHRVWKVLGPNGEALNIQSIIEN